MLFRYPNVWRGDDNCQYPPNTCADCYTLNHSNESVLLLHADFMPVIESIRALLSGIKKLDVIADGTAVPLIRLLFDHKYKSWLTNQTAILVLRTLMRIRAQRFSIPLERPVCPKGYVTPTGNWCCMNLQQVWHWRATSGGSGFISGIIYMPLTPMFHVHV